MIGRSSTTKGNGKKGIAVFVLPCDGETISLNRHDTSGVCESDKNFLKNFVRDKRGNMKSKPRRGK